NSGGLPPKGGGVSAIRFDRTGTVVDAYSICTGTVIKLRRRRHAVGHVADVRGGSGRSRVGRPAAGRCRGGAMRPARHLPARGRRRRSEAPHGVPHGRRARRALLPLPSRTLAHVDCGRNPAGGGGRRGGRGCLAAGARSQSGRGRHADSASGSEHALPRRRGITWNRNHVYFTTKGDNRVWDDDTQRGHLTILYDRSPDPGMTLGGVDNITAAR